MSIKEDKSILDIVLTDAVHRSQRLNCENYSSRTIYVMAKMDDEGTIFMSLSDGSGCSYEQPLIGKPKKLDELHPLLFPPKNFKNVNDTLTRLDGDIDHFEKNPLTTDERWSIEDAIHSCQHLQQRLEKILKQHKDTKEGSS